MLLWLVLTWDATLQAIPVRAETPKGTIGDLQLFPRIGIGIEYGGFVSQQENYASMMRRQLEMDLLQYRNHILYLDFNERIFFGIPGEKWQFSLMKYDLTLGGYRYDFGDFYLGIFMHHQCNNPFLTRTYHFFIGRENADIYDLGVEFLTKNMRLGMKDRGINFDSPEHFEFLGNLGAGFWASKTIYNSGIYLDGIIKGKVRLDILRYRRLIPYLELTGEVLVGPETRIVPAVEGGLRYHADNFDITPFFKWSNDQEALKTGYFSPPNLSSRNYLFGGARLETLLDKETFGRTGAGWQLFPEIHGQATYGLFLNVPNFVGHGQLEIDLEALRFNPWTIFLYSKSNIESRSFKPDKITFEFQSGLTYAWARYFAEGYVQYARRLDSFEFRGVAERSYLAGLRLGTRGMKPGHYNDGISFEGPCPLQWLNNWNAQASAGHYFQNRDWQYLWNLAAQVRWDPVRFYFIVPYVQAEVNWMSGGGPTRDATEYAVESGLRFHGVLDISLYYRFQRQTNVLFFGGPAGTQTLVGLRGLF